MTNRQEAKLNMYNAVLTFCNANTGITASVPAFATTLTALTNKIGSIDATAQGEAEVISGITVSKADLKKSLCQTAAANAAAVFAFASSGNNPVLKEKSRYTYSDLFKLKDDELNIICQNLLDEANAIIASLAPYGITAATITSFQTLIDDYSAEVPSPRNAVSQRAASRQQLVTLFDETDTLLKEQLDRLALQFKISDPEFYNTYKNNRIIIDAAVSPTQVAGTIADSVTRSPIYGAVIKYLGLPVNTTSELDGTYVAKNPDPGVYNIQFSAEGYKDTTISNVEIKLGQTTTLNVELVPLS